MNLIRFCFHCRFIGFVIILPMVQVILFNTAIGKKPKNLPLAVVNDESTCIHSNFDGCFLDDNSSIALSCRYLELLKKCSYDLVSTSSTHY